MPGRVEVFRCIVELSFFFSSRRRHTRLQGDWSSDVCSSDPYENSSHRRTHSIATTFGAAAAAGCAASLNTQQMRWVLNYAAEQSSGLASWNLDPDHIEKAFDFAGGSARNGATAAMVVHSGCPGLD